MHITQHTDYALRVLIYMAACPERLVTVKEIAERFEISRSHVMKIVSHLVGEEFIEGLRGKGGGLRLKRPAQQIVVGEVVRRMEPGFDLVDCFRSESSCLLSPGCRLKGAFGNALQAFLASLDEVTLADLVVHKTRLRGVLKIVEVGTSA